MIILSANTVRARKSFLNGPRKGFAATLAKRPLNGSALVIAAFANGLSLVELDPPGITNVATGRPEQIKKGLGPFGRKPFKLFGPRSHASAYLGAAESSPAAGKSSLVKMPLMSLAKPGILRGSSKCTMAV